MTRTNRGAEGISDRVIFADFFLLGCSKKSFGKNSGSPARLLSFRFHQRTGLTGAFSTIKRWLKVRHWVWIRCRRSLKDQQESAANEGRRMVVALQRREAVGEIVLFYLDESCFSADACVFYVWLRRTNPGFVSRQGVNYFHAVETTVKSVVNAESIAGFIRSLPICKLTAVIMDNAPPHRKTERESQVDWLLGHVWEWFLPPYSPELNLIEILWKKIKYVWLPWAAYANFQSLRRALGVFLKIMARDKNTRLIFYDCLCFCG